MGDAIKLELLLLSMAIWAIPFFIPVAITSCGGFGPSACASFKNIPNASQTNGSYLTQSRWSNKREMDRGSPGDLNTWNVLYEPTYWNTCFSKADAVMGACVQNGIILRIRTRNLAVMGRRPHPQP